MPFALELPFRDRSVSGIPATPRRLRAWLKPLHAAGPGETALHLVEMIEAQNQLALSPQQRLHLLETIRPAARAPLDALAARVQAQSLPLPGRTVEVARLTRRLITALLAGYETVLHASPTGRTSRRALAQVCERALQLRGELLLRHIEAQEPLPTPFWQQTYTLYAHAEDAGVAQRTVPDEQWHGRRRPTPKDAFLSLLLLALAQPRDLRSGEAQRIHQAVQAWCRAARLDAVAAAPADAAERGSVFAVALDAVTAPSQWRLRPGEGRTEDRVLDLAAVVARVETLHRAAADSVAAPGSAEAGDRTMGPTGLKRLLDNWNPRALSSAFTGSLGKPVVAAFGVESIHEQLDGGTKPRARSQNTRRYTQLRPSEVLQTVAQDEPTGPRSAYPHARAAVESAEPNPADAEAAAPPATDWLLEDLNATGFRLCWQGAGRSQAAVGALVAVRTNEATGNGAPTAPRWCVGVVRWQQFLDDERFAIGCELLSARPRPARVRHEPLDRHRKSCPRDEGVAALLLPSPDDGTAPSSLLIPVNRFHTQDILELDAGEHTLRVQLAALREPSTQFSLFGIAAAPARGRTSGVPESPTRGRSLAG